MVIRLTEKRIGGGLSRKEKTATRNGGVEEAENYKKGEQLDKIDANHTIIILFKTDYPPCFVPALLAGNAFFFKVLGK